MTNFADYVRHGWRLCRIKQKEKRPNYSGWNTLEKAIKSPTVADNLAGAGLLHAYSGTCALDVDDFDGARAYLADKGIDLDALFAAPGAVQIVSGSANRGKLVYALAAPLATKTVKNAEGQMMLELRCGATTGNSAQDVLPPTVHPNGNRYEWRGDWHNLPPLPDALHNLWTDLLGPSRVHEPAVSTNNEHPENVDALAAECRALIEKRDPDCDHDTWVNVGMALHHELGDAGLALWDEWSARGTKYPGPALLEQKWASFGHAPHPVTIASLRATDVASPDEFDDLTAAPAADEPDPWAEARAAKRARYAWRPLPDVANDPTPKWVIRGVLPQSGISMLFGPSGSGKSFAALDMLASVARGEPWNGCRVTKGAVGWVAAEAAASMRNRYRAYCQGSHLGFDALPNFYLLGGAVDLGNLEEMGLLAASAAPLGLSVIVVDTLAAASGGANENSGEDMGAVMEGCRLIHRATGAAVLLVHHTGKDEERGARGWSGIRAAVDAELQVGAYEAMPGVRTLTVTKMRDGADGALYAFKLAPVQVGFDDEGDPIDSCHVRWVEGAKMLTPGEQGGRPAGKQQLALEVLSNLRPVDGPDELAVSAYLDAVCEQLPVPVGKQRDRRRESANDYLRALVEKGMVRIEGNMLFITSAGGRICRKTVFRQGSGAEGIKSPSDDSAGAMPENLGGGQVDDLL